MKKWILIEMEHCPKCTTGMVQAFCYDEDGWRGEEKLECTQNNCDLKGKVIPDGNVFKCDYALQKLG